MFFFLNSKPLIFIMQGLCFYKFPNSFYKGRTESQMALAMIYINIMKPCQSDIKIQKIQRAKDNTERIILQKNSYMEFSDLYKPILNKMMPAHI